MARTRPLLAGAVTAVSIVLALSGCGGGEDGGPSITVYNAQHEELLDEASLPGFTEETGIEVELRNGADFELANQLVQEGDASPGRRLPHRELPGDVAGRQRGPVRAARQRDAGAGAGAVLAGQRQLDGVRRPLDGLGLQHRPGCRQAELPDSIMDLAEAASGRAGSRFSPDRRRLPGDRERRARARRAKQATEAWLKGLAENGTVYDGNSVVMRSRQLRRDRGRGRSTTTTGTATRPSRATTARTAELHFFGNQDPGAFVSVSGAGVLEVERQAGRGPAVRRVPHQRGGAAGPGRQLRARVPAQSRACQLDGDGQAARRAGAAAGRHRPSSTARR